MNLAGAAAHISNPHIPGNEGDYDDLVNALRKDLLLDPATDLLGGVLISVAGSPLYVATGSVVYTFTASDVSATVVTTHGLKGPNGPRVPLWVGLTNASGTNFAGAHLGATTTTTFTSWAYYNPQQPITGGAQFDWIAIG